MALMAKLFGGGGKGDKAMRQQEQMYQQQLAESRRHNLEVEKLNLSQLDLQKLQMEKIENQRTALEERDKANQAEDFAKKKQQLLRGGRRRDLTSASALGTGEGGDSLGGGVNLAG
jgi:ABC-type oligopeptide transport system ATPase subunit